MFIILLYGLIVLFSYYITMKFRKTSRSIHPVLSIPTYRFNVGSSVKKLPLKFDYRFDGEYSKSDYNNEKSKVNSELVGDSFHSSITGTLAMARALSLFPLHGIFGSPQDLKFKPKSVLSILSFLVTFPVLWVALTAAVYAGKTLARVKSDTSGSVVNKMAGCIFYLNAWICALLLRGIAKGWPELQARWRFEELRANIIRAPRLKIKIAAVAIIIMGLAIVEHWLSIMYKTRNCRAQWKLGNTTLADCLSEYCQDSHSFVFKLINYNTFLGVLIVLTSEIATFSWNFQDLFLIQISLALASRFKHINSVVDSLDIQNSQPSDWKVIRELYCGGLELTRQVATLLAPLVLLSFSNNLFFICLQMFNGLNPGNNGIVYKIYFFGSFGFMICRVTSVALTAAAIPLECKKHIPILRCCPSNSYCHEAHRLCQQLVHDDACLTGMGFFVVNRNFMLGVMGAIATYEIVLLQMV